MILYVKLPPFTSLVNVSFTTGEERTGQDMTTEDQPGVDPQRLHTTFTATIDPVAATALIVDQANQVVANGKFTTRDPGVNLQTLLTGATLTIVATTQGP